MGGEYLMILSGLLLMTAAPLGPNKVEALGFDLNEPYVEEDGESEESSVDSTSPKPPEVTTTTSLSEPTNETNDSGQLKQQTRIDPKKLQQLKALKIKIGKLFDVLKICDVHPFDINQIELPDSWEAQNKAIMALRQINSKKLIMKSEKPRYKRIMENCNKITEKVQERAERLMSIESQISGAEYEEFERFRQQVDTSPLDNLRSRFQRGDYNQIEETLKKRLEPETIREATGAAKRKPSDMEKVPILTRSPRFGLGKLITSNDLAPQLKPNQPLINFL